MVAEVFNLAQLPGYRTGGTIHVVINNQIGFTTPPSKGRSSVYSTDVAKINQIPIFHVNADDPEAAYRVLEIALDYRQEFHKDVVIDLIGFRRHGHNEGDEPTYTQPLMYKAIEAHPGVRTLYARRLIREGIVTEEEVKELEARQLAVYEAALAAAKEAASRPRGETAAGSTQSGLGVIEIETGVARETLAAIGRALTTVPAGFGLNPKMVQQLARRAKMAEGALPLDWGTAEALAFGSLVLEGTPVRVSGQDSSRGTFSHRHAVFHDTATGETWTPLATLDPKQAHFEACDSPLSEFAVHGFRLRLQRGVARGARPLGGPVRRLRERRPGHRGSVHRLGRGQVAPDALAWGCSCRTARKGRGPSIRARASSATSSSAPTGTCRSATRRTRRSTSISCAGRCASRSRSP